jgi:monothiol glutaredoxin
LFMLALPDVVGSSMDRDAGHCKPIAQDARNQSLAGRRHGSCACVRLDPPNRVSYLTIRRRTPAMSDAHDLIDTIVTANDVVLFMKGTSRMPMCGFSGTVVKILDHLGVDFHDVNVLADMDVREGVKAYSDWPTIPQLYVKGEFIGGCDIVREMFESGELRAMMEEKGVPVHT